MQRRTKLILAGTAVAAVIATGAGIGVAATSGDDDDVPITGDRLERASGAALTHLGEGRVTDTEVGDEEGAYEVEVTLDDGGQVDVHLNEDFEILSTEGDDESDDGEGEDED